MLIQFLHPDCFVGLLPSRQRVQGMFFLLWHVLILTVTPFVSHIEQWTWLALNTSRLIAPLHSLKKRLYRAPVLNQYCLVWEQQGNMNLILVEKVFQSNKSFIGPKKETAHKSMKPNSFIIEPFICQRTATACQAMLGRPEHGQIPEYARRNLQSST